MLKVYSEQDIKGFVRQRTGEQKLGEVVLAFSENWAQELKTSTARFIVVGIPEDVGVRANYGRPGANTAFKPALESFLNQQANSYLEQGSVAVLGEIRVDDLMAQAQELDVKKKEEIIVLRDLVALLDERVAGVVETIVAAGKVPVMIGGGHNNAYGNIKGASLALQQPINVINCDPHLDFRALEGRHSGNGFSYAFERSYLNRYAVFAMHEQYNNRASIDKFIQVPDRLFYTSYEAIYVREELSANKAIQHCVGFVKEGRCGVELDLDAITNVPTSAKTSSGISPLEARQFIHQCASKLTPVYLHIAEGAPVLSHIKADNKTGKLIAYLVSDFIKACSTKI